MRDPGRVPLEAQAQVERQPTCDGPFVFAVRARVGRVELPNRRIVIEFDLSRDAPIQVQLVLTRRAPVTLSLDEGRGKVFQSRLELVIAGEQVRTIQADIALEVPML